MIVSFTNQFVYIAIPRTGSTTIFHAVKPFGAAVVPYRTADPPCYKQDVNGFHDPCIPPELDRYFVFASVRNPYARMASHYRMAVNDTAHRLHGTTTGVEFPAFVEIVRLGRLLVPQTEFCGDAAIDAFVYLEGDLESQLQQLAPFKMGDVEVGAVNRSDYGRAWYAYYDTKTIRSVAEWAAEDFDRFGYSTAFQMAINNAPPSLSEATPNQKVD